MSVRRRGGFARWWRPVSVSLLALVVSHGCECDDEPVGPIEDWSLFACTLEPEALEFGQVPVAASRQHGFIVDLYGSPGTVIVRATPSCPFVSVEPAADTVVFDARRAFQVTYAPEAVDVLDCIVPVEIDPLITPPGGGTCPAVALSGGAFDPSARWTPCAEPANRGHSWNGIYGLASDEIYVAGADGRVIRYAGDCTWEALPTDAGTVDLVDIWAHAFGEGGAERSLWAVGNWTTQGIVLQSTGGSFSTFDASAFFTYGAVWGSGQCDVYFGGTGVATDFPNTQHWDCQDLEQFQIDFGMSPVTSVSGTGPDDVWAVLGEPTYQVYHFDGSGWAVATDPLMTQPLHDVWATASGHVWAVGEQGAIYHFDGNVWTDESREGAGTFYGVWAAETGEVVAVGEAGLAWLRVGDTWAPQDLDTSADLRDVWGSSAAEVFAVGSGALHRYRAPVG